MNRTNRKVALELNKIVVDADEESLFRVQQALDAAYQRGFKAATKRRKISIQPTQSDADNALMAMSEAFLQDRG